MSTHCVGWAAPSSSAGTACGHVHTQQAVQLQVCVPPVAQRRIGCRHNDEEHYNTERHRHLQQPAVGVQGVWWLRRRVAHSAAANARCTHPAARRTPPLGGLLSDGAASASCTVGLASLLSAALLLVLLSLGVPHSAWERRNTPPALRCLAAGSTAVCRQQGAWGRAAAVSKLLPTHPARACCIQQRQHISSLLPKQQGSMQLTLASRTLSHAWAVAK